MRIPEPVKEPVLESGRYYIGPILEAGMIVRCAPSQVDEMVSKIFKDCADKHGKVTLRIPKCGIARDYTQREFPRGDCLYQPGMWFIRWQLV